MNEEQARETPAITESERDRGGADATDGARNASADGARNANADNARSASAGMARLRGVLRRANARNALGDDALFTNSDLIRLIVPLVIEQFLAIAIGMADTVMVTALGDNAVSSISLVDSINTLLIQLFSAMSAGGAIVTAQYLGRQDRANACVAAKQLLYVTLLMSCAIAAMSLAFSQSILRAVFGTLDAEMTAYCRDYFFWSALSYPMLGVYNCGAALLRSMRNSKASMFTSLLMNVVNVGGNALLIYGLKFGVAGAGMASFASRTLGAVIVLRMLLNPDSLVYFKDPLHLRLKPDMIKRIFRLGIPNGMENSLFQVGKLMVAGIISTMPSAFIAANAISNTVTTMSNMAGSAIGLGMVTVVGQCVGAGKFDQARRYTRKLMWVIYAVGLVMYILLLSFTRNVVGIFPMSEDGVTEAVKILRYYAVCAVLIWPLSFSLPCALRAAGDARFTMTVSIASMFLCRILLSYLFVYGMKMGLLGIWVAMTLDWAVRVVFFVLRFRTDKWLKKRVV